MVRLQPRKSMMRRVLFFSFHYPPDQSAGAVRTRALVHEMVEQDLSVQVTVFCSVPRRYGVKAVGDTLDTFEQDRIRIRRFWILPLGRDPLPQFCRIHSILLKQCPLPSGCALASLLEPVPSS